MNVCNEPSGLAEGLERLGAASFMMLSSAIAPTIACWRRVTFSQHFEAGKLRSERCRSGSTGSWPLLPNALCYPELIPESQHEHCLYSSSQELKSLILQAADQPERQRILV